MKKKKLKQTHLVKIASFPFNTFIKLSFITQFFDNLLFIGHDSLLVVVI